MTLNWNETATDCQVVQLLSPHIQGKYWCGQNWYQKDPDGTWNRVPRKGRLMVQALWKLRGEVPDTPFWARTRHRLSTAHGTTQILALLAMACNIGMITGPGPVIDPHDCLCWGGNCREVTR